MTDQATQQRVFWGDARAMGDISDKQVHLIVTSPPYWQIKDYGAANQIGFHDSLDDYLSNLQQVWSECHRVLHDGCRMCINIGDQFARAVHYGRYKVIPLHASIIESCERVGFDFMGSIIWQKQTTMNTSGGGAVMGSFPHPRNGIVKIDYEFILLFKKLGKAPKVSPEQKRQSTLTTAQWNEYFAGHWNFPGERQGDGHIAMFPPELPRRLIQMFSFQGETVLDPFLGSGTTLRATMELGRNGIGYEINRDFEGAMRQRLGLNENTLFDTREVEFLVSQSTLAPVSAPAEPRQIPLRPEMQMQRQVDTKQHRFNSVVSIEDAETPRQRGLRVREVLTPHRVQLQNGTVIQLLGVRPIPECQADALDWLRERVVGREVFLRFDDDLKSKNGIVLAYLHLSNKTFVNAKLLRLGLAQVDKEVTHALSARFEACARQAQTEALDV